MVKMQSCAAGLTVQPFTSVPEIIYKHNNMYYSCTVSIIKEWHISNFNGPFIILTTDEHFWKQKFQKFFYVMTWKLFQVNILFSSQYIALSSIWNLPWLLSSCGIIFYISWWILTFNPLVFWSLLTNTWLFR
jgi:hypothetical protein